jgi:hypothetical protein
MISVCLSLWHVLLEAELPAPCSGCIGGAIRLPSLPPCFVEAQHAQVGRVFAAKVVRETGAGGRPQQRQGQLLLILQTATAV